MKKALETKGEKTARVLREAALSLFAEKGFHPTNMREIAARAGTSLGLTYRYFSSKEAIVLAGYIELAADFSATYRVVEDAPLGTRFQHAIEAKVALLAPQESAFSALVGAALDPRSPANVAAPSTAAVRQALRRLFAAVAHGCVSEHQESAVGDLLHTAHLFVLLAWIHRRSDAQFARFLESVARALNAAAPFFVLPQAAAILTAVHRQLQSFFDENTVPG